MANRFSIAVLLNPETRFRRRTVFAVALMFVLLTFADVFFQRATISMLDNQNITGAKRDRVSLFTEEDWRYPYMGYYDSGGAGFQSEPAQFFMKNVIYGLESPYWDPYTSAGSFGPELLVDLKFSPFTIVGALGGGSLKSFHFAAFLMYTLGLFFLFRLCNEVFRLSPIASIGGSLVYLLGGYFTANLNSNATQVYFYIPMVLFFLLSFHHDRIDTRRQLAWNYIFATLSIGCLFLCTFIPTTSLALTLCFIIAAVPAVAAGSTTTDRIRRFALSTSPFAVAFLLVAFLYFPIVEVLIFSKGLDAYGERLFFPSNWMSFISLFTPKHLAESYNAGLQKFLDFQYNVIFHFGIFPLLMAVYAFTDRRNFRNPAFLAILFIFAITIGRIFGVFGISDLVSHAPFFRNIGCQYWWIVPGSLVPLLVAFGFESTLRRRPNPWIASAVCTLVVIGAFIVYFKVGFNDVPGHLERGFAEYYLRAMALFLILGAAFFWLRSARLVRPNAAQRFFTKHEPKFIVGFAFLIFAELTFYTNHVRFTRLDLARVPDYVEFLKKNLGDYRIANYGQHGVPAQMGAGWGIAQLESFAMHLTPDYAEFCNRAITNEAIGSGSVAFCTTRGDAAGVKVIPEVLDMMAVKYFVVGRYMTKYTDYFEAKNLKVAFESFGVKIYENPYPLPRLFAVPTLVKADLTPEVHQIDARRAAVSLDETLLEQAKAAGITSSYEANQHAGNTNASASNPTAGVIQTYHNASLSGEIDMPTAGVLVLMDNWHPSWTAFVDGTETYIGKVNQSFRGIVLPAGKHKIEMSYRPKTLTLGLWLGFFGLLILGSSFYWIRFMDFSDGEDRRTK